MKLFYKKDYQRALEIIEEKDEKIEKLEEQIKKNDYKYFDKYCAYKTKYDNLEKENIENQITMVNQNEKIANLKLKYRKANCAIGGCNTSIKSLKKQLAAANETIKLRDSEILDLKSSRYLKVKVEPDKSKSNQKMQIYSTRTSKNSGIIKKVKNNEE